MLVSKFRVLEAPISCKIENVDIIIKALCVLHNFIRKNDGRFSNPTQFYNSEVDATIESHVGNIVQQGQDHLITLLNFVIGFANILCSPTLHYLGKIIILSIRLIFYVISNLWRNALLSFIVHSLIIIVLNFYSRVINYIVSGAITNQSGPIK